MPTKLRAIDQGTRYDCVGKLRRFTRRIESGDLRPINIVVVTTEHTGRLGTSPTVILHHFGPGTIEDVHWMLSTAKNRIEPA